MLKFDKRTSLFASGTKPKEADVALAVSDLTVHFDGKPVIQDVTFSVNAGERVAVVGLGGAGKSTLIKTIVGFIQPQAGSIKISGENTNGVGYVPQFEGVDWNFPVTVCDVVMMERNRHIGWLSRPVTANWRVAYAALQRVGMAHMADRQISELNAGQQRRTFIARALAQGAHILLLDEPFSGVDAPTQANLMETLDDLNHDGMTLVIATRDVEMAFSQFDRVLALRQHVIAYGTAAEIFSPELLAKLSSSETAAV